MTKKKQRLVVTMCGTKYAEQPDAPISNVQEMIRWCRANLTEPGEYELIREVPGVIKISVHEQKSFKFA